ncbi:hypothetical protein Tco_0195545 [Tanacetum coccineum]
MDNPNITMEEYIQYETEKALINNQVYNWKTAKYGKIWYIEDINYLIFFETKFPAIVYNDALKSESEFSAEPTISSQHVDEVNWKNETSLLECDYEEYNFISERKALKKRFSKKEKFNILSIDKDLFSYEISSDNNLQIDKGNDDDKTADMDEYGFVIRQNMVAITSDSERLKADRMIRVNKLVTVLLIGSSIHLLDQNRYPVIISLIHIESRKSPSHSCLMMTLEGFPSSL